MILTAAFWTPRIDALTNNVGRAMRGGLQAVALAYFAKTTKTVQTFDITLAVAAFLSGVMLSFMTTFAKPPVPPGGDPALDLPVRPADAGLALIELLVGGIILLVLAYLLFRR